MLKILVKICRRSRHLFIVHDKWIRKPENKHLDLQHDKNVEQIANKYENILNDLMNKNVQMKKLIKCLKKLN